jgi:hypothetical protein
MVSATLRLPGSVGHRWARCAWLGLGSGLGSVCLGSVCLGSVGCYNFLYSFKGAPSARQADLSRPRLARDTRTSTDSVDERGVPCRSGQRWGFSP